MEIIHLKYMKAKITYAGVQRMERYFVPDAALREALLNALCHKDYSRGVPIQISVYEDKLYIANCGHLPENWTIETLMNKHVSTPFNPNIAHVYYLSGFIESWGRGIEKIFHACKADGVYPPEYTINPGDIMVKFTAPEERIIRLNTSAAAEQVTNEVTNRVTNDEITVLTLLKHDPRLSYDDIAKELHVSRKTIGKRIKSLKEKGVISRIGSNATGYWKIND